MNGVAFLQDLVYLVFYNLMPSNPSKFCIFWPGGLYVTCSGNITTGKGTCMGHGHLRLLENEIQKLDRSLAAASGPRTCTLRVRRALAMHKTQF